MATLARRLGAFDATMIVMGGIIGSGIFMNPYVVARQVHTPALIVGAWAAGGVIALLGAFAYAELAALRPDVGGQYAYLRDAYHPSVAFAYGCWQTASFISGELKRPRRDLALGLLIGVIGVIAVYVGVNIVCVRALGADGLAQTTAPASAVMRLALGERGARLIAAGIAVSTLGFLSQSMLTAPRVYYAMAADGVFFRSVARIHPTTHVPIVAIALQGIVAVVITLSGTYEQILSYVVSTDFIFFGLTGLALFVFRRRQPPGEFRTPGHPLTTAVFVLACWAIVAATLIKSPIT